MFYNVIYLKKKCGVCGEFAGGTIERCQRKRTLDEALEKVLVLAKLQFEMARYGSCLNFKTSFDDSYSCCCSLNLTMHGSIVKLIWTLPIKVLPLRFFYDMKSPLHWDHFEINTLSENPTSVLRPWILLPIELVKYFCKLHPMPLQMK